MKIEEAIEWLSNPSIIPSIFNYRTRESLRTLLKASKKRFHKGSWIGEGESTGTGTDSPIYDKWRCSECDYRIAEDDVTHLHKFCPECGDDKRDFLQTINHKYDFTGE